MSTNSRFILFIAAIFALALGGYAAMNLLIYTFSMSETSTAKHFFYTLATIALGLTVPYWMVKWMFHAAHINNPDEPEMTLRDIPKDKDQLTGHHGV